MADIETPEERKKRLSRERSQRYRDKHLEEVRARNREYMVSYREAPENKARQAAYHAEYRQTKAAALAESATHRYDKNHAERRAKQAEYYIENAEVIRAKAKSYREQNREKVAAINRFWVETNRELSNSIKKAWATRNPMKVKLARDQRRRRVIKATPNWVDKSAISDVYIEAEYMQMTVDHIIPLSHKKVCGLHVAENLQLLTKSANSRKSNKFDPEAFNAS